MDEGEGEPVQFSTDDLPPGDRIAMWREWFGRHIVRAKYETIPSAPFSHTAKLQRLPGLLLMSATAAGFRSERTGELIAVDGRDDVILAINIEGTFHASQCGRETSIAPNQGVLLSAAEIAAVHYPMPARFVLARMPRGAISSMVDDVESIFARPLPPSDALRLLARYIAAFDRQALTSPALRRAVATHVQDLVALAIGATCDAQANAQGRGLRAARLAAVKSDVEANLGDSSLSTDTVAARHGVTPRYVRMLFEDEGLSFSEFLLDRRLARTHRMLTNMRFAWRTISSIALDAGFADLSYFNRTFRRRYGATPSDVRAQARREGMKGGDCMSDT
jgi:AraC-like DNA-binding protein